LAAPSRKHKEYSKSEIVLGNAAIILWIALGGIILGVFYPLAGLVYSAALAFLVFFEVGKHGCVTCYYCKTCTIGMGKLPEFFFKRGGAANVNRRAQKLFRLVFVLLSVFPLVLVSFSIWQEPVFYKVALLAGLLVYSLVSGVVRRRILWR
jgi:hypothetical protein